MNTDLTTSLRPALVMTLLFALLLGIAYPLALTGIGQALFPAQANGSLITDKGRIIGSAVVGQSFTGDRYFNSRPSAAGEGYDGLASSGSNLGPASRVLADRVKADVARFGGSPARPVPADLVTASGSGLDPDLSPAAAYFQVTRVASARGLPEAQVRTLVDSAIRRPLLGIPGDPHVNLLELNRRLDALAATRG